MSAFPWRWVLLGVALSVLLGCGMGWWWLTSTRDLAAFAVQAKAAGVSLAPEEIDPIADAAWSSWSHDLETPVFTSVGVVEMTPGIQAALDPRCDELLARLDTLPAGRIRSASFPDAVRGLFIARLGFASPGTIPALVHRMQRFAHAMLGRTDSGYYRDPVVSSLEGMSRVLARRCQELDVQDRLDLARDLTLIADDVEGELRTSGLRFLRQAYSDAWMPHGLCGAWGIRLPGPYGLMPSLGGVLLDRAGRRRLLADVLEWHRTMVACADERAFIAWVRREQAKPSMGWKELLPAYFLRRQVPFTYAARSSLPLILQCRVLAAELAGKPWPVDPFAVPGTPLQRVERDGVLVGAWSVGFDGVADGGDRSRDLCIPLTRQVMGRPHMGDALPPPDPPIEVGTAISPSPPRRAKRHRMELDDDDM